MPEHIEGLSGASAWTPKRVIAAGAAILVGACGLMWTWGAMISSGSPDTRPDPIDPGLCTTIDGRLAGWLRADELVIVDTESGRAVTRRPRASPRTALACGTREVRTLEPDRGVQREGSRFRWERESSPGADEMPLRAGSLGHVLVYRETHRKPGALRGSGESVVTLRAALRVISSDGRTREHDIAGDERLLLVAARGDGLLRNDRLAALSWIDLATGEHRPAPELANACGLPLAIDDAATRIVYDCRDGVFVHDISGHRDLSRHSGRPGDDVAALSPDGHRLYLRRDRSLVAARDDGTPLYETAVAGFRPTLVPLPDHDVLVLSEGLLVRIADADGRVLWRLTQ